MRAPPAARSATAHGSESGPLPSRTNSTIASTLSSTTDRSPPQMPVASSIVAAPLTSPSHAVHVAFASPPNGTQTPQASGSHGGALGGGNGGADGGGGGLGLGGGGDG